jgi:hypothetical protein
MSADGLLQRYRIAGYLLWVLLVAFMFAEVEIQIEGAAGWAASLPTWRVEGHWLLDLVWGGRPLTGYHAWVFSFMALIFHLPMFFAQRWDWRQESRVLGGLMLFWIVEDFLWFALNPAYGLERFAPALIPWHKHWWLGVPTDYVTFSVAGISLIALSLWPDRRRQAS